VFLEFRKEVADSLREALKEKNWDIPDLALTESPHADLTSLAAFKLASTLKQNPAEIASELALHLKTTRLIGSIKAAGPYLNFQVSQSYLEETLKQVLQQDKNYGNLSKKGKVILEHTSANPNGPLHVGHIRNSVIGDTLSRILKRAGWEVETQYYINDMGRQIAIVVWALENFKLDTSKKPDHAIAEIYVKGNKKLEEEPEKKEEIERLLGEIETGEPETQERFKQAVETAMKGIKTTLQRMNIHHDSFVWESKFVRNGSVKKVIKELEKLGRLKEDNGALLVGLEDLGFEKDLVVMRKDGTSLYTTRDLAYHIWKSEQCDRVIDILGADHKLISNQLKTVLSILKVPQPEVVIFEFVSLPEGSMSTRRGVFISADELLDEIEKQALLEVKKRRPETSPAFQEEVARMVGTGAVRYDIVKVSAEKSTVFDWQAALDFEKQGAPFIQYAHARACSILRKAEEKGITPYPEAPPREEPETLLLKKLGYFPQVIETSAQTLDPTKLAIYARELAFTFNQFYRDIPVINAPPPLRETRLALVKAAKIGLANTLETLGIAAPTTM